MRISLARLCHCRGFSVTEASVILMGLSILSGLAAPAVHDYVEQAKMVKARHDVKTIGVTLVRLVNDVGTQGAASGWGAHDLLVGSGPIPAAGSGAVIAWTAPLDGSRVGHLDDHLVTNAAGYAASAGTARYGWRGAYIQERIGADPWGMRYSVNIASMRHPHADTIALSAGPDGVVTSPFVADGVATRGDDVAAVVTSASPLR